MMKKSLCDHIDPPSGRLSREMEGRLVNGYQNGPKASIQSIVKARNTEHTGT